MADPRRREQRQLCGSRNDLGHAGNGNGDEHLGARLHHHAGAAHLERCGRSMPSGHHLPGSNTFPITNVPFCVSDPGTALGTDAFVQSVDIIVSHTWNDDLDIQLINPNGTIVNLVNDRFGSGDGLGNPALCPGGLFTLAAGGHRAEQHRYEQRGGHLYP
ncbi:MAG: hypothetical protein IPI07_03280 [Flavobacteriales bacterium]|nr:hypothetical protein [Flavobacteriales bacterium]